MSQNLIIVWSPQTRSCSQAFNCAANAITWTFSKWSGEEMPRSYHFSLPHGSISFLKFFLFLYCAAQVSEKYITFLGFCIVFVKNSVSAFGNRWTATMSCTLVSKIPTKLTGLFETSITVSHSISNVHFHFSTNDDHDHKISFLKKRLKQLALFLVRTDSAVSVHCRFRKLKRASFLQVKKSVQKEYH
jgi:hypothetical protein